MVMNSSIHLKIKTSIKDKIKGEAYNQGISLSEFCREQIIKNPRLDRIELLLYNLLKKFNGIQQANSKTN